VIRFPEQVVIAQELFGMTCFALALLAVGLAVGIVLTGTLLLTGVSRQAEHDWLPVEERQRYHQLGEGGWQSIDWSSTRRTCVD
jgi:hypothetical protein